MDEQQIFEIHQRLETLSSQQRATAHAMRSLADGLQHADKNHQNGLDKLEQAILELIATTGRSALARATAEDLANIVPNEAICKARNIQWARKKGEPEPLPDPPTALLPHRHQDNGRHRDDSLAIKTDRGGITRIHANLPVKTISQWIVAMVGFALLLWHMIADQQEKKAAHLEPPPAIAAPK